MKLDIWKNRRLTVRQSLMPRPQPTPEIPPLEPKPATRAGNEFKGGAGVMPSEDISRFFPHRRR